jgi:hypothetical protein
MAWIDLPIGKIKFGFFAANPATATVSVAASDLMLFRYKILGTDTVPRQQGLLQAGQRRGFGCHDGAHRAVCQRLRASDRRSEHVQ